MLTPALLVKSMWGIPGVRNEEESDGESMSENDSTRPERDDGAPQVIPSVMGALTDTPPNGDNLGSVLNTPRNEPESNLGSSDANYACSLPVISILTNMDATGEPRPTCLSALENVRPLDSPLATCSDAKSTVANTVSQESSRYVHTPNSQGRGSGLPPSSALAPWGEDPAVEDLEGEDAISGVNNRTTY
ncbi:unnamed protein product [Rhizoctonia solani]|uniref:Uncharacterized protein n=1 Tax=Rhizoctonia solani TaxID=456999 RepID=A0A8H3HFA1_9AGAM|nr:unnamed protein product [Rhizoctonia solani]